MGEVAVVRDVIRANTRTMIDKGFEQYVYKILFFLRYDRHDQNGTDNVRLTKQHLHELLLCDEYRGISPLMIEIIKFRNSLMLFALFPCYKIL